MHPEIALLGQHFESMATRDSAPLLSQNAIYMSSLPASFQEMTDVVLVVEDVALPAHKAILAANSKVFADLLASQEPAASTQQKVPLVGESLQDAIKALTFLYSNCVFSTNVQSINSPEDAKPLIKFGHKYGMQGMLDAIETHLISQVQEGDGENGMYVMMKSNEAVVSWTALAEGFGLSRLLAHCERFMVMDHDTSLWHDKALVADGVSRASLLRILRALQYSRSRMQANLSHKRDYDVDISTLMQWQKSAEP